MKPLEVGCLAIMLRGDNCGKVVTCLARITPPAAVNLQLAGTYHHGVQFEVSDTDSDGKVWAVSGDITARGTFPGNSVENRLIEIYAENLKCNGMYPSKWLMRIDDDSDVNGESNPYVQKLQDDATKKKPLVPLIFSKFGPHPFFKHP
jgi:hypothetical protein